MSISINGAIYVFEACGPVQNLSVFLWVV